MRNWTSVHLDVNYERSSLGWPWNLTVQARTVSVESS